jgi:hypothetical protein
MRDSEPHEAGRQGVSISSVVPSAAPAGPKAPIMNEAGARALRPPNPQFPFPRFPIWRQFWPGIGEGIPDSRFGQNRESGNPLFPIRPETGIGTPIWPKIGKSGMLIPCEFITIQNITGERFLHGFQGT